jgi:hypothetical protein
MKCILSRDWSVWQQSILIVFVFLARPGIPGSIRILICRWMKNSRPMEHIMKAKPTLYTFFRVIQFGALVMMLSVWDTTSNDALGATRSGPAQDNVIGRYLKRYRRVEMDSAATARRVRSTGKLSLPTEEGIMDINLTPNDVRAPRYRAEEVTDSGGLLPVNPEPIRTYRGTVSGIRGSEVRFSISDDILEGIVLMPNEWLLVEPMRNYDSTSGRSEMVVYRASDIEPGAIGTCATALAERIINAQEHLTPQMMEAGGSISVAEVATEADYEYVAAFGNSASANNSILDIMNQVDGIYRTQLSISLQVVYQHAWATQADPYTSTAPSTMLNEFRSYWEVNFGSMPYDLAHMWTGKDMDGSTVGIAYVSVVCNARSYSYGISQKLTPAPGKYILTAHEIGHNFGATHTEQADPPQSDCSNTIMNSAIGSSTDFCPYSRAEITSHAAQYPWCMAAVSGGCDINSDGVEDVLDIQYLVNVILGADVCPGICDTDKNGSVNVLDLQLLANVVLGTAICP